MKKELRNSQFQDKHKSSFEQKEQQTQENKKRANFMNVLFYITRFKRKMRSKINLKQFQSLKNWHFKLISDQSYFIKNDQDSNQESINKFFSKIKTFSPTSFVVVVWHLIILLILLIQLFFIPMKAGFALRLDQGFWMYFLRILPAVAFSIEILLKFNTGYYEEGQIVMDRKKIISSYIKWKFWIDLSATSSILANQSIDSMWLDFIQFIHIQQMTNLIDFLDDHFQISQRFQTLFELVKLIFLIVVVAHFCGCAFHFIAQIEMQMGSTETWLQYKELQDEDWLVRYINSLYWAIITMNTVGYGDIAPNTSVEKVYVTINTLVCCGVFGYAINTIGSIVREIALKEAAYKQIKYDISMYMRNRNISREVQLKVFKILEYQNQQALEGTHKASQILEKVPNTIQNEVYMEFYGKILHQCKIFRFHFSDKFINALSLKMKETTIGPGEIVFKQGEQDSRIFFILKGEVDIYVAQGNEDEKDKKLLTKINAGNFFGHSEFFTNQERQFTCQASSTCNLVSLTNQDAVSMLKDYQRDYENFCKLRDNLLLYGNQIDQKCLSCYQFTHSILDCPLIHLSLDKEFILKKNNFNVYQERGAYQRVAKDIKALLHNQDIRYLSRKVRIDTVVEQRPDYLENLEDCLYETDQEFLTKTPIIKFHFGDDYEELQISEESEEDDELDKDLEEVRSNMQNPFGNMQHDNLLHMGSIKSNSQLKNNLNTNSSSAANTLNTTQNNSNSTPNNRNIQSQQTELSMQRQTSMQNFSQHQQHQQGRRLTAQNSYLQQQLKYQQMREQNSQQLTQQQQISTNSQKSLSSMTDIQLQPQGSSTMVVGAIQQLAQQNQQSYNQSLYNQSPTIIPQIPTQNTSVFHLGNSNIVNFSTAVTDKVTFSSHNKIQNINLLNVDSNDIYQPSQISKRSQQQKSTYIEDNKSVVSSKSGGKAKDIEKLDSFVQKSPEEQVIKKFGILDFDLRKDYEFYFPHNNLSAILEKIKQKAEVKLIGTLNVALNIGNLQMRKIVKQNTSHKLKLARSNSRVNQRNEHHLSISTSNIAIDQQQNAQLLVQSPSRFKNKIP